MAKAQENEVAEDPDRIDLSICGILSYRSESIVRRRTFWVTEWFYEPLALLNLPKSF